MKNIGSIILLSTLFSSLSFAQEEKYPLLLISHTGFDQTTESSGALHPHDVLDRLKDTIEATSPKNVLLLVKDGFTSKDLITHAQQFTNLKTMLLTHTQMFSNMREPFDFESIKSEFPSTKQYTVQSLDEFHILQGKLFQDLAESQENLNVFIVEIKEQMPIDEFDRVFVDVKGEILVLHPETLVVVSGREGKDAQRILNLQQTDGQQVNGTPKVKADTPIPSDFTSISYYMSPNIGTGLFVAAFCVFFLIFGFLQILALQTPNYFATQNIDFGKIEK